MTQEALADAVGLNRTAVTRLERGERKLNVTELVAVAAALGQPLSYFVADPVPAVVSRRRDTAHAHSTTRLLDLRLEQFALDVREMLAMELLRPVDRPVKARVPRTHEEAEGTATTVRRRLDIGSDPIEDLGQVCESLGLLVFSTPLGETGPDGGCVELGGDTLALGASVVNSDSPAGRRRMTLTHELGHWLFGDAYDLEASAKSEQMINSFAIHLLAPRAGVLRVWEEHSQWSPRDRALAIGAAFRLSWSATLGQIRNLQLIGYDEYRTLSEYEPRSGDYLRLGLAWSDELSSDYLSPGFVSAVLGGYVSRRLTSDRALELLRGTLPSHELPQLTALGMDDLRGSFTGHDE